MNSTATKQVKSRKRTSHVRTKQPARRRRTPQKSAEPMRHADWASYGLALEPGGLPAWADLGAGKEKTKITRPVREKVDSFLEHISTGQFTLFIVAVALALGLYVSHVFATQETLARLERLKRENIQLQLQYNQMKGRVGRELSPTVIYHRALELGLREGFDYEPAIRWSAGEES